MSSYLTPQEIHDYGEEFLNVVGKKAREVTAGQVSQLASQVHQFNSQLHGQARQGMKAEMDRALPNWRQVNEDPRFLEWLGVRHEFVGRTRHELLQEAWASNDASRVLAIFRDYAGGAARAAGPTFQGRDGRFYRGTVGEPPVMTRQEIELHYHNHMRGRVSDEEHRKFEARMEAAAKAGRISGGMDVDGK
jgi:hypothetical protein